MPEALAVIAVFVVVVVAWIGAWMHARNPVGSRVSDDIARVKHHVAWLEQRIDVAQRENWGADMVATLEDERETTLRQLARLTKSERVA